MFCTLRNFKIRDKMNLCKQFHYVRVKVLRNWVTLINAIHFTYNRNTCIENIKWWRNTVLRTEDKFSAWQMSLQDPRSLGQHYTHVLLRHMRVPVLKKVTFEWRVERQFGKFCAQTLSSIQDITKPEEKPIHF